MSKKRRTQRDRNHDAYESLRSRIRDIYSRARSFHMTHDQVLERMTAEVWNDPRIVKLTRDYRAMLSEVARSAGEQNYAHLEWRLGPQSGPLPGARPGEWTEELSTLCRIPGALYGAHFWAGTDRPFGEYKPTN